MQQLWQELRLECHAWAVWVRPLSFRCLWPAALSAVGDVTDPYIYGIHTPWRGILYHSAASPDLLKPTQGSVRMEFSRTSLS